MELARKFKVVNAGGVGNRPSAIDDSPQAEYAKSVTKLAWLFDCSKVTIGNWTNDGAPAKTKLGYNIQHWIKWCRARDTDISQRPEDASAAEAERLWKIARAGREQLKFEHDKSKLVDASEARTKREQIIRWFLSAFEQLGPEIQIELAPSLGMKAARASRKAVEGYVRRLRKRSAEGG